jgi:hypothetical protein
MLRTTRPALLALALGLACQAPAPAPTAVVAGPLPVSAESFEIQVWRAGRTIPPCIPAARRAELEEARAAAMEALMQRPFQESALGALLRQAQGADELWAAAARVAGRLGLYGLAEPIAAELAAGAPPTRMAAARQALHALYGRWFRTADELEPFRRAVRGGEGTRLLLESQAWEEGRSRERLLAQLAHDPVGAVAWLDDPDPRVRAGAARLLAGLFTSGAPESGTALDALIAHLELEPDARAFHDGLDAAIVPLERAEPGSVLLGRLRTQLETLIRAPLDPRQPSAAAALARLPWNTTGALDGAHVLVGLDTLGYALGTLAAGDRARGVNDPDSLVVVLGAVRALSDRATAAGLAASLNSSRVREAVFGILSDPAQASAARSTAAAMLGAFCSGEDGPRLAAVLRDGGAGTAVQHALLGSLRVVLAGLDPDEDGARALVGALGELTGAENLDLRRRALALCADPALAAHVKRLDPAFLLERLTQEQSLESAADLLRLVARIGNAELLGPLLSMPGFDLLAADSERLTLLASTIDALVQGAPRRVMAAALRLAGTGEEAGNLMRLRQALRLVARLDPTAALGLGPVEHRAVCTWVWRLACAGTAPAAILPEGQAFERRLLDVHLPRAGLEAVREAGDVGPFEGAHLAALLRADLFLTVGDGAKAQVEAAFEAAARLAPEGVGTPELLRDRARFRAAASEGVKAMADYRRLIDGSPDILGLPDLRTAVGLVERLSEPAGREQPAARREASDLLRLIVQRPAWRSEPATVRMQDLRSLVLATVGGRDRERLTWLEAELAELPLTQTETPAATTTGGEGKPALWFGLTRENGWLQELLDLRAKVRLALRQLDTAG